LCLLFIEVFKALIPAEFSQLTIQLPCTNNVAEEVIAEAKAAKEAKEAARK